LCNTLGFGIRRPLPCGCGFSLPLLLSLVISLLLGGALGIRLTLLAITLCGRVTLLPVVSSALLVITPCGRITLLPVVFSALLGITLCGRITLLPLVIRALLRRALYIRIKRASFRSRRQTQSGKLLPSGRLFPLRRQFRTGGARRKQLFPKFLQFWIVRVCR
jgi:hypothetical protein